MNDPITGLPVDLNLLGKELARPSLASVRNIFSPHLAQGLTPDMLGAFLRESEYGYPWNWLDIAEEMEEKYLHYQSVLSTRKRAVIGLEPQVEAADESAECQAHADFIRETLVNDDFTDTQFDLLDGLGKGFAVVEAIWDTKGKDGTWRPSQLKWVDPRFFAIDPNDGETILLRDASGFYPLPPYKFIIHKPKIKSGITIRGGLARAASWAYIFQNYTVKNWLAFLEVYGMPLRLGKFDNTATADDKTQLLAALKGLGTDAAAIVPKWAEIEFKEASGKTQSSEVYKMMCDHTNDQVSKAVLGQTFTMGGGHSQGLGHSGKPQENVRIDILQSDARQLSGTISKTIVQWMIDLNFPGPHDAYPAYKLPVKEADDLQALGQFLQIGLPYSPGITAKWFRDKIGAPDPQDGDVLLAAAPPATAPQPGAAPAPAKPDAQPRTATIGDDAKAPVKPRPVKAPPPAAPEPEDPTLTKTIAPPITKPMLTGTFMQPPTATIPYIPPVPFGVHRMKVAPGDAKTNRKRLNALTVKYREAQSKATAKVEAAAGKVDKLADLIAAELRKQSRK